MLIPYLSNKLKKKALLHERITPAGNGLALFLMSKIARVPIKTPKNFLLSPPALKPTNP